MRLTPESELVERYGRLRGLMADEGLDAVILLQNADLFYFTGTIQSGNLYVPVEGEPVYMVRRDFHRAKQESALKHIVPFTSMREIPEILSRYDFCNPKRIGMEMDVLPAAFLEKYRKVFPDVEFLDATPLVRKVRMIKSEYEIGIMREAARQVDKVYRQACVLVREGISEIELAARLEYAARIEGHLGLIRMRAFNGEMMFGHTLSGSDAAIPAYTDTPLGGAGLSPSFGQGAGRRLIGRNEPVVIDFAGSVDGYLVDQTRVFAVESLPAEFVAAYDDMLAVQDKMMDLVKPGAVWGEIYDACLNLAIEKGHRDNFMGFKNAQVSFIGHGIGVEIDEYPFLARGFTGMVMEPGMVFAFEPKLVFPDRGAVGIEDTFLLTEQGVERLTFSSQEIVIV